MESVKNLDACERAPQIRSHPSRKRSDPQNENRPVLRDTGGAERRAGASRSALARGTPAAMDEQRAAEQAGDEHRQRAGLRGIGSIRDAYDVPP